MGGETKGNGKVWGIEVKEKGRGLGGETYRGKGRTIVFPGGQFQGGGEGEGEGAHYRMGLLNRGEGESLWRNEKD